MISGGQEVKIYDKNHFCNDPRSTVAAEKSECEKQYDQFHQGLSEENSQALNKIVSDACYIDKSSSALNPAKCAADYFEHPETLKAGAAVPAPQGVEPRMPNLLTHADLGAMHNALKADSAGNSDGVDSDGSANTAGTDSYHTIDGNRLNEPFVPVEKVEGG